MEEPTVPQVEEPELFGILPSCKNDEMETCDNYLDFLDTSNYAKSLPELISVDIPPNPSSRKLTFGLGNTSFIHSVQMILHSKQSNPSTPVELVPNEQYQVVENLPLSAAESLLRRSIVTSCVYAGFDKASSRTLDIMLDVTSLFIQKICKIFKMTIDINHRKGRSELDCLIQVLEEIGFPLPLLVDQVNSWNRRKERLTNELSIRIAGSFSNPPEIRIKDEESDPLPPLDLNVDMEDGEEKKTATLDQPIEDWDNMTDQEIYNVFSGDA